MQRIPRNALADPEGRAFTSIVGADIALVEHAACDRATVIAHLNLQIGENGRWSRR
jgi:hypothetical protein